MSHGPRRSGTSLVLVGFASLAFFWLTDSRYGLGLRWMHGDNAVDLANQSLGGTLVGVVGSIFVLLIGLWLLTRRTT